ncbi:uncharacterized protein [Penaeus vannamei]|uniref:Male reproductive-related protein A n=1 Tax=Penaeus vannamei TaxID=6689 RepID=A0A423TPK3_PENVA|nr:male reproductive-related protein A [Penaeus vannamei]
MKLFPFVVLVALAVGLEARRIERQAPPLSTGHFSASQQGDALTKVSSKSDTRLGKTETGVKGMLANSGKLRGAADAQSADGGKTQSMYAGDMKGKGGMWADTKSSAGPKGQSSSTALKGYISDGGAISGSVGAGSTS